jgi:hypothetical protein
MIRAEKLSLRQTIITLLYGVQFRLSRAQGRLITRGVYFRDFFHSNLRNFLKNSLQIALDTVLRAYLSIMPILTNLCITFRGLLKPHFPNTGNTVPSDQPFEPPEIDFIPNNFQMALYLSIKNISPTLQKVFHIFIPSFLRISNPLTPGRPQPLSSFYAPKIEASSLKMLLQEQLPIKSGYWGKFTFSARLDTIVPMNLDIVRGWA